MKILLFFTIGATIVNLGESVKCYNCVDDMDNVPGLQKCSLPFSPTDSNSKCNERGYCMKGVGQYGEKKIVMRQCVPVPAGTPLETPKEPFELNIAGFTLKAHICDTDLCNTAAIKNPHIFLGILIFSIILLL